MFPVQRIREVVTYTCQKRLCKAKMGEFRDDLNRLSLTLYAGEDTKISRLFISYDFFQSTKLI